MKINWHRIVGIAVLISALTVILMLTLRLEFPTYDSAEPVTIETTTFLWTYRLMDVIGQAFVLFVAAVCCVALLRIVEEKR